MTARTADYLPQKISQFVPDMSYAADVVMEGTFRAQLGASVAFDLDGIIVSQSMTSAGNLTTFASAYSSDVMGRYGRGVLVDSSGANADKAVTITGRDYLGQPMTEDITLNGITAVLGKKAFKFVEKVTWLDESGENLTVGWTDVMGLPYKSELLVAELLEATADGGFVVVPNAGAFIAGVAATATATTGDTRGTYLAATEIPNGIRVNDLILAVDRNNLHGVAQFLA